MKTIMFAALALLGSQPAAFAQSYRGDRAAVKAAKQALSEYRKTGQTKTVTADGTVVRLYHNPESRDFMGMTSKGSPKVNLYTVRPDRSGITSRNFTAATPEAEPVQSYVGRNGMTGSSIRKNGNGPLLVSTPDLTARPTRTGGGSVSLPTRIGELTRDGKGRFAGSKKLVDSKAAEGDRIRVWEGRTDEE